MFNYRNLVRMMVAVMVTVLAGCNATMPIAGSGNVLVGPSATQTAALGSTNKKTYNYTSKVFLDVAVPVFDPGFALTRSGEIDYAKNDKDGIWPQLRRAEAKKFAVQTKKALEKVKSFGTVNVTPTPATTADLFVLGKILQSDSEIVKIKVTVLDSSGKVWGNKSLKHSVAEGFFRDAANKDKDPYGPVYTMAANYVYDLLMKKTDQEKQAVKSMTSVRYAEYYSPESFSQYLKTKRTLTSTYYELLGMPSENDGMLKRTSMLQQQDKMFVSRLQDQYEAFDMTTSEHYRAWQKETLPEAIAARKAKTSRNVKAAASGLMVITSLMVGKNSNSSMAGATTVATALAGAALAKSALDDNEEVKIYRATLDEMGENLDLAISPSVMTFNKEQVKLSGTAAEQYEQWKAHLRKIHDLENGNLARL